MEQITLYNDIRYTTICDDKQYRFLLPTVTQVEERIKYRDCILIFKSSTAYHHHTYIQLLVNDQYYIQLVMLYTVLLFIPNCKTDFKMKTLAVSGAKL